MTTTLAALRTLKKSYETAIAKQGKKIVADIFAEWFGKNPKVEAVRWAQYTPAFNDGDPCTFGVHELHFRFAEAAAKTAAPNTGDEGAEREDDGDDGYGDGDEDGGFTYVSEWRAKEDDAPYTLAQCRRCEALNRVASEFEDVFERVFGDGYRITATRDGFDVEEYYHD